MKKIVIFILVFLTLSVLGCSYSGSPKRGIVTDGVYTNDYFKLSFTIPEGWHAFTDEEMYENFEFSTATDDDLANSKMGFGDAFFYKTVDSKECINVYYSITENEKNLTDEQMKNRLSVQTSDVAFGEVEPVKIGEADYAMISGLSSDGTLTYYYVWSKEVCGYLRPTIYMQLDSGDSVNDILKNFNQIISAD